MAKQKTSPATAAPVAVDVQHSVSPADVATLKAIPVDGFTHLTDAEGANLVQLGYVEVNPGMVQGDKKAARLTEAGKSFLSSLPADAVTSTSTGASDAKFASAIVNDFEMPAARRVGPKRSETYPFSKLELNQAFFIPATAEKPNPEKSFASSVISARARFATVTSETRKNRKGRDVPVLTFTRDFQIRRLEDGAPFGMAGTPGAVVKRIA